MSSRDTFQRNAGTAPLGQAQTRPLQLNADRRQEMARLVAESQPSLEKFRERVEVLMRACEEAQIPIPGVDRQPYRHTLSLKGEQIMHYLLAEFQAHESLVPPVQQVVYRYFEAVKVVDAAARALSRNGEEPGLLEALRRNLFYFSRSYLAFKDDPVLSQLFPPPVAVNKDAGKALPLTAAQRMRERHTRESLLLKVESLVANLKPRMDVVAAALSLVSDRGLKVGAFLSPDARKARVTALVLVTDPAAEQLLRTAVVAYEGLGRELAAIQGGKSELDALRAAVVAVSQQVISCQKMAMLQSLLPFPPTDLFPRAEDLEG